MTDDRLRIPDSHPERTTGVLTVLALLMSLLAAVVQPAQPSHASTMEQIWVDSDSGLALAGYDPLSYFVDGRARLGRADYELSWRGVTWRFSNEGNLEAFRRNSHVYAPQLGGYGVMAIVKGWPATGNPEIWAVYDNKLYLFHSEASFTAWSLDRLKWTKLAVDRWPGVRKTLSR